MTKLLTWRPSRASRHTILIAVVALSAFCLSACEGSGRSVNTADRTSPTLRWSVRNLDTGDTKEYTGSKNISASDNETFQIILKANAPGGIHRIRLNGEASWSCHGDDVSQNRNPVLQPRESVYTTAQAPTYSFLVAGDLFGWECSPDLGNPTGRLSFAGEAENFTPGGSAGTTQATLTVCNSRGCDG